MTRTRAKTHCAILLGILLGAVELSAQAADCPKPAGCVVPESCAVDARGNPNRTRPDDQDPIASAKFSEGLENGNLRLREDVEIQQGTRIMRTEEVEYKTATDDFVIPGKVELIDPNLRLTGSGATTDREGNATFDNTEFAIPARAGHGSAKKIQLSADGAVDLESVNYTTCPTPNPAWELKLSRLHVDEEAHVGSGSGIRVELKGIPILYVPYISFPVGNEPKSGLLFPEFGHSSQSGWNLSLPWYWRIADNYDATFTPSWYSSRGVDLGGEFRFATVKSKGQLNARYMPEDKQTDTERTYAQILEQTDFTPRLRFRANAVNLGDTAWYEDFGGAPYTSIVALPRNAELAYRSDQWSAQIRALNYQIIDPQITSANRPFTLLPQAAFQGYFRDLPLGFEASLDAEFTAFKRTIDASQGINSQRFDVLPELRLPMRGSGAYLEPAAALRYTTYWLDPTSVAPGADLTPSRTAPMLSLDGGMIFEREAGSHRDRIQTLEPRFLYAYVPYRNQDNLPVFDTAPPDFNLIQLFQIERYAGPDRLGDVNHVAMGVTTRLFGAEGNQILSATLGELYRFEEQRVVLPGETQESRGSSDVIGELDLWAYRHWNARVALQWDPTEAQFERTEFNFQYRRDPRSVVNVGYRYRRFNTLAQSNSSATTEEGLQQVDSSVAWPIGSSWSLYGRVVYSIKDDSAIERLGGFEYRSCCWGVRLFARRSVSSQTGGSNWEVKAQLELTGLSNVGNPVDSFLAGAIQGYSAARNDFSSIPD